MEFSPGSRRRAEGYAFGPVISRAGLSLQPLLQLPLLIAPLPTPTSGPWCLPFPLPKIPFSAFTCSLLRGALPGGRLRTRVSGCTTPFPVFLEARLHDAEGLSPQWGVALEGAASLSCSCLVLPGPWCLCWESSTQWGSEDVLVLDMVLSIEREAAANTPHFIQNHCGSERWADLNQFTWLLSGGGRIQPAS